jgi:hypothetical protein
MSEQVTYEGVLELIRQEIRQEMRREAKERDAAFDRRMQEADRRMAKTDLQIKRTSREVGKLGNRMGSIIERMVAGKNIIKKFQDLGYIIESYSRNKTFGNGSPDGVQGEIDLFLENGDIAILISVKTNLTAKKVYNHAECLEKFRRDSDRKGDKRRFIGAVAGAVVEDDAMEVAHENGMYVITQSGKVMKILPTPEGFQAKEW